MSYAAKWTAAEGIGREEIPVTTRPIEAQYIAGHIGHWPDGRLRWPTLSVCLKCGGFASIVRGYPDVPRYEPEDATRIALMEHGYNLAKWEGHNVANAFHVPHPCTCGHLHDFGISHDASLFWPSVRLTCRECGYSQGKPDSSD